MYRITFRLHLTTLLCISLLYLILILLLFFIRFCSFSRSRSLSRSSSTIRPEIFLLRFPSDFPLSPEVVLSLDPLQRFDLKYFFSGSLQVQNSESL
ncbi:hypothetical protein SLEP1_g13648 [Rubroshorea leprosula]|uniref:Uncharacterized protein n=1 Tax=Rubroshorea leprosula TaxID=152421 RepID=A0AAV5IGL7_9ROSI|nr:hypothetical protein SLEP1_g13648 [Rubroshorea leprosula]